MSCITTDVHLETLGISMALSASVLHTLASDAYIWVKYGEGTLLYIKVKHAETVTFLLVMAVIALKSFQTLPVAQMVLNITHASHLLS